MCELFCWTPEYNVEIDVVLLGALSEITGDMDIGLEGPEEVGLFVKNCSKEDEKFGPPWFG